MEWERGQESEGEGEKVGEREGEGGRRSEHEGIEEILPLLTAAVRMRLLQFELKMWLGLGT